MAAKSITAVKRQAVIKDMENFHKKKLIAKTRRYENTDTEKKKNSLTTEARRTRRKEIVFFICRETPVRSSGPMGQATTNKKVSAPAGQDVVAKSKD